MDENVGTVLEHSPARIQSFSEFWPYYIGEHRKPACRILHFVGTSSFLCTVIASLALHPVRMGACLIAGLVVGFLARRTEAKRKAAFEAVSIAVLWIIGSPWIAAGIVGAYFCAWIGHFGVEGNRPATFQYPLWSLFGDFKMVGCMLMGRLWSGDPLQGS